MKKEVVATQLAPAAIGPYSQAVKVGPFVYLSGQIGLDPATGELVAGGFEAQVRQAFANMSQVVAAAGGTLADVVKLTLFLTDLSNFAQVNQIMVEQMPEPYPAHSTVGVAS
ncbi:MAG TPA: Rid family detoxifying hydrolase, partial [Burkholderiaceae bacterium]|nr:Rid family detoxifying hydrolase [Burkholderiaceae bacterium]